MRAEPSAVGAAALRRADPRGGLPPHRSAVLAGLQPALAAATVADPFTIVVVGDSQASISRPNYTGQVPWPMLLAEQFGGQNCRWAYASAPSADYPTMTSGGTDTIEAVGGFGSTLAVGQSAELVVDYCTDLRIWWRGSMVTDDGGPVIPTVLELRDGSAVGPVLATISNHGVGSSLFSDLTVGGALPEVALGMWGGTLHLVNAGPGSFTVEAAYYRTRCPVIVANASHGGWSTAVFTADGRRAAHAIARMAPDLVLLATGTNDDAGNIVDRLSTLIDQTRAASPTSAIVLVGPTTSTGFTAAELTLVDQVAQAKGVPLLSLANLYPGGITAATRNSSDNLHWSRVAHQTIARWLHAAIAGDAPTRVWSSTMAAIGEAGYLPADAADWPDEPWSVGAALDALAARVAALEP